MPLADAVRLAAGSAVYDTRLAMEYRANNAALMNVFRVTWPAGNGDLSGSVELPMGSYFAQSDPAAVAGLVGSFAGAGFDAAVPLSASISTSTIAAVSMNKEADGLIEEADLIQRVRSGTAPRCRSAPRAMVGERDRAC